VLSANGSNNNFTPPTTTNASGVSTSTFTSTTAEPKTITVTINGTQINAQPAVTVDAAAADTLVFTTQPTTTTATNPINLGTGIVVTARDAFGNTAKSFAGSVSLSITTGTGTGGAALSGVNNPMTASQGVATFTGLSIDLTGTGYTLDAAATGVKTGRSTTFNIN
jgi:hypothetical protein